MEGFDLSMDDILDASELELSEPPKQEVVEPEENKENKEEKENIVDNTAEVLDASHLELESVGSGKSENKGSTVEDAEASSPNTYSSIASAFKVDGVPLFSDADEERINGLSSAEDFEDFIKEKLEEAVNNRLEETTKRVNDALTYGMAPSDIQVFENSIKNLNSIKEEDLSAETEEGESLRRQLIYTDLINRGYSESVARKKTQKSFDDESDIDDARDALEANKEYYKTEYTKAFNEQKSKYDEVQRQRSEYSEKLRKSIMDDEKAFGETKVSKQIRQKIYDAIWKPVGKDANGNGVTAIQKYADENPVEFRKNLAYYFVITDGFKNLDKVKEIVGSEVREKEISALERTLNSTARDSNGQLKLVGGNYGFGSSEPQWQIEL